MHSLSIYDINFALKDDTEALPVIKAMAAKGYVPFYHSLLERAWSVLGTHSEDVTPANIFTDSHVFDYDVDGQQRETVFPELFHKNGHLVGLATRDSRTRIVILRHAKASIELPAAADDYVAAVLQEVDGRRTKNWTPEVKAIDVPSLFSSRRPEGTSGKKFSELQLTAADYAPDQLKHAILLSDDGLRGAALTIAKSGKLKIDDARKDFSDPVLERLRGEGLLKTEYLVQCRQTSATLCTVPDKQELLTHYGAHFRCPHCNRLFQDELIVDILSPSDACRRMTEKSHWMTVWITSLVESAGVPRKSIAWNACAQSDEIDIVADVLGTKIFFELKDREFGLGDAYPFNYRIHRYGGSYGVVVTADKVSSEAERFFKEQAGLEEGKLVIFDKDSFVSEKLPAFVSTLIVDASVRQVTRYLSISALMETRLLQCWLRSWCSQ